MTERPAVLLLVNDDAYRTVLSTRLVDLNVRPILVRAEAATRAVEQYVPISAIMDEAHAASAPDDFLAAVCSQHVRLLTLPDHRLGQTISDVVLLDAATPRPAFNPASTVPLSEPRADRRRCSPPTERTATA
jgi:hypothetical protein